MARISSHVLDGVRGVHAGGVAITLVRAGAGAGEPPLFVAATDAGGRLVETVAPDSIDPDALYDLVFRTGAYWSGRPGAEAAAGGGIPEIVLRFRMSDPHAAYHLPIILSPHGYATWLSGEAAAPPGTGSQ